jgi:hypothetical protein
VTKNSYHTGEDSFPRYDEIYQIFNISNFSSNSEDLGVYQNIQKSGIHLIVAHPTLFPYNEATHWCFK